MHSFISPLTLKTITIEEIQALGPDTRSMISCWSASSNFYFIFSSSATGTRLAGCWIEVTLWSFESLTFVSLNLGNGSWFSTRCTFNPHLRTLKFNSGFTSQQRLTSLFNDMKGCNIFQFFYRNRSLENALDSIFFAKEIVPWPQINYHGYNGRQWYIQLTHRFQRPWSENSRTLAWLLRSYSRAVGCSLPLTGKSV